MNVYVCKDTVLVLLDTGVAREDYSLLVGGGG